MNERDDYLLDPAAAPDPEVAGLERALAPLRWREAPLRPSPRRWWGSWLAAAATLLAAAGAWAWWRDGSLRPDAPGRTFVTGEVEQTIRLGDLAEITLKPGSELAFLHWRVDQARFALVRGGLAARVEPPPKVQRGFFVVDTPRGSVVDQGCRYTLDLLADGTAHVAVTEGAVTFALGERVAFVPAGASIEVGPLGPRTPCFDDAAPELAAAIREFDLLAAKGADLGPRADALKRVLAAARAPRDSLVLWHLLRDPEPMLRQAAEAHLLDLVGPPFPAKQSTFDPEQWLPFLRLGCWQPAK